MKITAKRDDMRRALMRLRQVVPSKSSLPVLECVRITSRGDAISIEATDLDRSALVMVRCEVEEDGATCVPHKRLLAWLNLAPEDEVSLRRDTREQLHCTSGHNRTRIAGTHTDEYPRLPDRESMAPLGSYDAAALLAAIERVKRAQSSDETRPAFGGVHWMQTTGCLTLTATDGHRLHQSRCEPREGAADVEVIVPGLQGLSAFLAGADEVRVRASEKEMACETDDARLTLRLIPGRFPNVAQVIPDVDAPGSRWQRLMVPDGRAFAEVIKRVSLAAPQTGSTRLQMDEGEPISLHATSGEEEATEPILGASADALDPVGFNASLGMDALAALDAGAIEVWSAGTDAPMLWRSPTDPTTLCVVMPMQF